MLSLKAWFIIFSHLIFLKMDTSVFGSEAKILEQKIRQHAPVTYREVALVIATHEQTLLKFLADNDPAQVYRLLHESDSSMVIGNGASFIPNKKRVEGELKLLVVKKDYAVLNDIISKFKINRSAQNITGNTRILKELQNIGAIKETDGGLVFTVKFV